MGQARSVFLVAAVLAALVGTAHTEEYLTNGDFESTNALRGWTVRADRAKVEPTGTGGWIKLTVAFNSGPYSRAHLNIGAYGSPTGRCWIDNLRPQGFAVKNPSFEQVSGKRFVDWGHEGPGAWTHVSTEHVSHGKHSLMIFDPSTARQMIRVGQDLELRPQTDYSYTFDFFMENDFNAGIRCGVYTYDQGYYHMGGVSAVGGVEGVEIDDLIADRAAAGFQQCRLSLEGGSASISQQASVPDGMHLAARVSVKAKELAGEVTLAVVDPKSKEVLASVSASDTKGLWETMHLPFVSRGGIVAVRVTGQGTGQVILDGVSLSRPCLRPGVQSVEWRDADEDFVMKGAVSFDIDGESGDVLETGLGMLRKDLGGLNVELGEKPEVGAPISIRVGEGLADVPADTGREAYFLEVSSRGVRVDASTERGAFCGLMTLLQLLSARADGEPAVIACEITDWPDLPWRALNRGAPGLTPEWLARRKANIAFHVGKDLSEWRRHGIEPIPHENITHFPYHNPPPEWPDVLKDPNMAEGIGKEEKLKLVGETPVELSERNVIRTKLIDVTVKSEDPKTAYTLGEDFRVIDGEISCPFKDDAKPFAIARIAGGRISDGATVAVTYEHVPRHTGSGPVLCLAEPAPQETIAQMVKEMVAEGDLPFVGLHVSEEPRIIGKGPRCKATGLSASELLARYYEKLDRAIKDANPACRMVCHADDFMPWQHSSRSGLADVAKMLPKDAILSCWFYSPSASASYACKTAKLWDGLGHEFFLVGMNDYLNIHIFAAAAKWARSKGMPCLGTSSWGYHLGVNKGRERPAPFLEETLCCAWRVPRKGERGYVDFDAELRKVSAAIGD